MPLFAPGLTKSKDLNQQVSLNQPFELARLSETVSLYSSGGGNSAISLSDGRELVTPYVGPEELRLALQQNQAQPRSLASADFDEDGVPDLVSGYSYNDRE